ncbi:MAG TPA: response regulator [Polyangia bacterium]
MSTNLSTALDDGPLVTKPGEKPQALLVDDDPDFLEQMRRGLESLGFDVTTAESEKGATEQLSHWCPDLVVLDLIMDHPDSGFLLSYRVRKKYPKTPIIMVSAVTSRTGLNFEAVTPTERGWVKADALLAKPVRLEQLKREVERLLPGRV